MLTSSEISKIVVETSNAAMAEAMAAGFKYNLFLLTEEEISCTLSNANAEHLELLIEMCRMPGAQCATGPLVENITKIMGDQMAPMIFSLGGSQADIDALWAMYAAYDGIIVYVDNMVRLFQSWPNSQDWTDEMFRTHIRNITRGTIGHECRHAVQRATLLNEQQLRQAMAEIGRIGVTAYMSSQEGINEYLSRPEEADAYAFQRALQSGEVRFSDILSWHSENVEAN